MRIDAAAVLLFYVAKIIVRIPKHFPMLTSQTSPESHFQGEWSTKNTGKERRKDKTRMGVQKLEQG